MATRPSLTRLMRDAQARLPGALDSAIQAEVFNVLNEFFQDSNAWREDIAVPVVANVTTYALAPSCNAMINRFLWAYNSARVPVYASLPQVGDLTLRSAPSQADTYTVTVALTVTDPVTKDGFPLCPDWTFDKYGSGILDGVLGRMMSQPAKPYYSQQLAIMHLRRFRQTVSLARVEASHDTVYRGASWAFPQSFAVRRK